MSSAPPPPPADPTDHAAVRLDKLRQIEALGIDPWGQRFEAHSGIEDVLALPADRPEGERPRVRVAGRPAMRRTKGDQKGKHESTEYLGLSSTVQVMLGQSQIGEQGWALAQLLDLGDLIGIDGTFGKTKMGEPTVFAEKLTILAKSLEPHPDKWSGMQDMEYRLRHRYLDLTYNPESLDRAKKRVQLIRTMRNYLDARGYLEVETPTLHAIAGGAAARPFATHHNALDIPLFLRIALELPLKKLLVGGIEKVYEIGRVFRNEGISPRHNPEFTMLELYEAYGDLFSIMELTEGLIVACVDSLRQGRSLPYGERVVNFEPPFDRAKYADLFREHVGVDMLDRDAVSAAAIAANIPTVGTDALSNYAAAYGAALTQQPVPEAVKVPKEHEVLVHELFERKVEPQLVKSDRPVFVYDYPAALCPLTKRKKDCPELAERFELYVHGTELANAYTELNDPITQEATFRRQLAGLSEEESMAKMDEDFIRALRHGMPPAGGLGIGIDRLVMFLTNTPTIRDVILFPLLRPEQPRPAP